MFSLVHEARCSPAAGDPIWQIDHRTGHIVYSVTGAVIQNVDRQAAGSAIDLHLHITEVAWFAHTLD